MSKKEHKFGKCPLCLIEAELTEEHIPPKGVFLNIPKSELFKIYACSKCNNKTHKDDEYFRNFIASANSNNPQLRKLYSEKTVKSSYVRSPGLKSLAQDEYQLAQKYFHQNPLYDIQGNNVTKDATFTEVERINNVLIKMVKGLYYYKEKSYMPENFTIDIKLHLPQSSPIFSTLARRIINNRKGKIGNEFCDFIYSYKTYDIHSYKMKWNFMFYKAIILEVDVKS
ncbi:MAG: hypothetical protein Q6358_03010 [Candidatus Brocadiales bacterium]|nr:hypothetical protein [Candidatus Brocadiales bacterium]